MAVDNAVDTVEGELPTSQVSISPSQGDCHPGTSDEVSDSLEPLDVEEQSDMRDDVPDELWEEFEKEAAAERGYEDEADFRDDDGAVVFEDQSGESRFVRLPPDVPIPSKEMVRRHRASGHCPYRSWCATCVAGAANMPGHGPRCGAPIGDIPEMHADYAFFRDKKGDRENTATVLVAKDRGSGGYCANVVPRKGVGGGFIVKQFERDLRKFGHRKKVLIRTDGEHAIRDLAEKVADLRAPETVLEHTPKGDSRANGRVERAVQTIEKQVRVMKMSTEELVGKFGVKHRAFPWLVVHAADVLNKYQVQADGLTPYEKVKGREYSGLMLEFGSVVLHKASAKVQGGLMEPRWMKGLWLGKRFGSEEHIVSTPEGNVIRSCAVKPHPEIQWDTELFDALKGSPWNPQGQDAEP